MKRRSRGFQQLAFVLVQLIFLLSTCWPNNTCDASSSSLTRKTTCDQPEGDTRVEPIEDGYCDSGESRKTSLQSSETEESECLRAAVINYSRIDGAGDCEIIVDKNLDVYEKIARLARENGVQMLVFPEDGIYTGTARSIKPCLEEIPDPKLVPDYVPCSQPNRFNQTFTILTRLSCMAKENGLYVIANFGTKQKRACDSEPCDEYDSPVLTKGVFGDYLMLNTDVVFDPTGRFIGRYRKWNPFTETEMFAKAPRLEHVYFDTEFGRFGVFTCFDMLFKEPAMELVEKYNIDTAIFPTWWFDELPILTAVQYQEGWSYANRVNLLASNILKPSLGSTGSGIFSTNNQSLYVGPDYDTPGQPRKTKILISTIPAKKIDSQKGDLKSTDSSCEIDLGPKVIEVDDNANFEGYRHKNYKLQASDAIDGLDKVEDTKTICAGSVCCTVVYELHSALEAHPDQVNRVIIIARNSLRVGGWYEQVCALVTLKKPYLGDATGSDQTSLQDVLYDAEAAVSFKRLHLKSTFTTKYVFPSSAHNMTKLVERDQREMTCRESSYGDGTSHECELSYLPNESNIESNKLYSFGMYARVFERDPKKHV